MFLWQDLLLHKLQLETQERNSFQPTIYKISGHFGDRFFVTISGFLYGLQKKKRFPAILLMSDRRRNYYRYRYNRLLYL